MLRTVDSYDNITRFLAFEKAFYQISGDWRFSWGFLPPVPQNWRKRRIQSPSSPRSAKNRRLNASAPSRFMWLMSR